MISVFIADDHAIVRQGLKQIVSDTNNIRLAGEAATGQETLRLVRSGTSCDVLVLDLNMPGISGLDILRVLKAERPNLPVLILSIHAEDQYAVRCLQAGAAGYLTKESAPEELVEAIRQVVAGGKYVSRGLAEALAMRLNETEERPPHETLSDREFQVLQLMGAGNSLTEIAAALSLSVKTVSTYRARMLEKLGLKSSTEIIQYAIQNRLVPPE
jgi:two-component system invasion response regulator UvrY